TAGDRIAQVLGRAPGHALPSGRHSRYGNSSSWKTTYGIDEAQHRLAKFPALRLWRPVARRSKLGSGPSSLAWIAKAAVVGRSDERCCSLARLQILWQRWRRSL